MKISHILVAVGFLLVGGLIGSKWPSLNVLTKLPVVGTGG